MSWDIELRDPVTKETLHTQAPHAMGGGTCALNGTSEMWLNITYNYASYYNNAVLRGIHAIDGKTGAESLKILDDMIAQIEAKYKLRGRWLTTEIGVSEGDTTNYWMATAANALRPLYQLMVFARLRPDGVWAVE